MDVNKILAQLRQEHAQIEEVIVSLEILASSRERRRGRPPALLAAARKRIREQNHAKSPHRKPAAAPEPRVMAAGQAPSDIG